MRGEARAPGRGTIGRDATMYPHQVAIAIHRARQREIENRLRVRAGLRKRRRESPLRVRRRLGHGLIRLGWALAFDGPLRVSGRAALNASLGSPTETLK